MKHWRPLASRALSSQLVPSFRAALAVASVSDLVALVTGSFFNATQGHQAKSASRSNQELPATGSHGGDHGFTNVAPLRRRSGASAGPCEVLVLATCREQGNKGPVPGRRRPVRVDHPPLGTREPAQPSYFTGSGHRVDPVSPVETAHRSLP